MKGTSDVHYVTKMVEQKHAVTTVTISDITEQDAKDLLSIFNYIGGSPDGPRGAVNRLFSALADAGVVPGSIKARTTGVSLYVERA